MKYPGLLNKAKTNDAVSDVITVNSITDLPYNSKSGSIAEVTNKGVKELVLDDVLPRLFYIHINNTSVGDIAYTDGDKKLSILEDLTAVYYDLNNQKKIINYKRRVAILELIYREYELYDNLSWKNLNNIKLFAFITSKIPYIYNGDKWELMDYVQKSDFVFDDTPTQGSSNLLTSDIIYNELNDKADLINGKVPSDLLPSYVDDVVEFPTFLDFPEIGESGKIYIDISTNSCYRWSGSTYIEIQSPIELDEYPTLDSENAVLSGGVYSALLEKLYVISDLSEIRQGAALGATALLPEDISGKQDILTAGDGIAIDNSDTIRTTGIPFGRCDSTSTATVFTATVPGIYKLEDGVCCMIKNGVVTSKAGFTLNVNGLGAKPCYNNMTAATAETTLFNVNYTILFVYDSTRGASGGWIYYRGYDSVNSNSIGYQLRGNNAALPVSDTARYYKLYFTSADGTMRVPASINSTNNATTIREVNQRPINPFGLILYTSASTNYTVGTNLAVTTAWSQYALALGYSFNRTGATLELTFPAPVYIKCAPQTDGSAIIDANTPYVQSLPSTNDGKIYIFLGIAYSATNVELLNNHPVYYHDGTGIRLWPGKIIPSKVSDLTNDAGYLTSFTETDPTVPNHVKSITQLNITDWNNKADVFTINCVYNGTDIVSCDKTFAQILEAYNAGKILTVVINNGFAVGLLTLFLSNGAAFNVIDTDSYSITSYELTIWASNTYEIIVKELYQPDLSSYADSAEYDSTNHLIYLKHGSTRLANPINASDFIKDGMVDTVTVTGGNLVITFNTDSGKLPITIPISDIFDANNYYNKTESDARYLLNFTETDPIYSASVAAEITSSDISNWNSKQDELISGTNIKTVNSNSILGSGNINLKANNILMSDDDPNGDWVEGDNVEEALVAKSNAINALQPNEIASISTAESSVSGGNNSVTITESNGTTHTFNVKNGTDGQDGVNGQDGADGVSLGEIALVLTTGDATDAVMSQKAVTEYGRKVTAEDLAGTSDWIKAKLTEEGWEFGKYVASNGSTAANASYCASCYIPMSNFKGHTITIGFMYNTWSTGCVAWYDSNKSFISGLYYTTNINNVRVLTIDTSSSWDSAAYIRITLNPNKLNECYIIDNTTEEFIFNGSDYIEEICDDNVINYNMFANSQKRVLTTNDYNGTSTWVRKQLSKLGWFIGVYQNSNGAIGGANVNMAVSPFMEIDPSLGHTYIFQPQKDSTTQNPYVVYFDENGTNIANNYTASNGATITSTPTNASIVKFRFSCNINRIPEVYVLDSTTGKYLFKGDEYLAEICKNCTVDLGYIKDTMIAQETGDSTLKVMSQNAVDKAIEDAPLRKMRFNNYAVFGAYTNKTCTSVDTYNIDELKVITSLRIVDTFGANNPSYYNYGLGHILGIVNASSPTTDYLSLYGDGYNLYLWFKKNGTNVLKYSLGNSNGRKILRTFARIDLYGKTVSLYSKAGDGTYLTLVENYDISELDLSNLQEVKIVTSVGTSHNDKLLFNHVQINNYIIDPKTELDTVVNYGEYSTKSSHKLETKSPTPSTLMFTNEGEQTGITVTLNDPLHKIITVDRDTAGLVYNFGFYSFVSSPSQMQTYAYEIYKVKFTNVTSNLLTRGWSENSMGSSYILNPETYTYTKIPMDSSTGTVLEYEIEEGKTYFFIYVIGSGYHTRYNHYLGGHFTMEITEPTTYCVGSMNLCGEYYDGQYFCGHIPFKSGENFIPSVYGQFNDTYNLPAMKGRMRLSGANVLIYNGSAWKQINNS